MTQKRKKIKRTTE